ncbi:unnamed protein product [Cladocopium goreaui]|uniref:Uncharacterized protein n=1 Tax=Cladocopium goreaui TaxID=2562237 RepID=A0A9P1DJ94_9DINO|nr:unnamed protein product [Cladocopium goreaui]
MGNVRAYDPDPVIPPDDVKLQDFSFKLIQVEAVAGQTDGRKFSDKYKVKVPANIRGRYADDVVFGGDWKELLTDFDKKFNIKYSAPASPAPAKPDTPEKPPWVGEPSTMQALLDRYNVEAKITGRLPGTTLFVVSARDRAGKSENIEEHQEFKLFLAAHIPVEIDPEEFILAHGTSRFLRPEKVQDLKRKGKTGLPCSH